MTLAWFALAVVYLSFIFWLGSWGDSHSTRARKLSSHPFVYAFALAIYCTAWTFFGAVGEAVRNHWNYLPILLGPALLYLLGYKIIIKLINVSKKQHITTIADLVSSRYGKRQNVALMVTLIVLLATIPYIALQLQAIGAAFSLVSGAQNTTVVVIIATVFIGAFCVFFGTRRTDVTEYRHGLMLSIAFESVLKIVALFVVALFALWAINFEQVALSDHFYNTEHAKASFSSVSFWLQTIIAAAAVLCLPRQFHVAIIDNLDIKHVNTARWLFPGYLMLIALLIPVIATAGINLFGGSSISPDNYVMSVSRFSDSVLLQALVFLGGLSAATAMIVISTLTLSTMVSNDVILPKLLNNREPAQNKQSHIHLILWLRRVVIAGILVLGFGYHIFLSGNMSLNTLGLLAFSLVIQLLPAIIGGLYWQKAHANGVIAGLVAGIFAWVLFLIFPLSSGTGNQLLDSNLVSITATLSLAVNICFFVVFSYMASPNLMDKMQAQSFVTNRDVSQQEVAAQSSQVKNEDLLTVLKTFLGDQRTRQLLGDYSTYQQKQLNPDDLPTQDFVIFCERALGGVIGASSSNLLINAVLKDQQMNFEQLVNVFDDTTQAIQANQNMLFASLESLAQGISVVDKDLCLVAWNKGYLEVFNYPEELVKVGVSIEELVRFNAERGECGPGEVDQLVNKRLEHLRAGKPHKFVRQRSDGRVIEMIGNPLPHGGFVTSFNDISEHIELQKALEEANIDLQKRVTSRADEVKAINSELRHEIARRAEIEQQLIEARELAEQANDSKTRFLALASHDILQPINSAKLYLSATENMDMSEELRTTLNKLDSSIHAGESLIATLLEIARLDQGALSPQFCSHDLSETLQRLQQEFSSLAQQKDLKFKMHYPAELWVKTDPVWLHRVIRNLVSNALKYTHSGGVLLTVRPRKNSYLVQVWDTGEGISETDSNKIFDDFYRAHDGNEQGIGLGLAVVSRLSKLLGLDLKLRSHKNKGSCFSLHLKRAEVQPKTQAKAAKQSELSGLTVLCLDDDKTNLDAMATLLENWQIKVLLAHNSQTAMKLLKEKPDVILADYQLGESSNGLDFIELARTECGGHLEAVLTTAVRKQEVIDKANEADVNYLPKPVKPAKLRVLLRSFK